MRLVRGALDWLMDLSCSIFLGYGLLKDKRGSNGDMIV